jgi:4-amino-4-deoxy-L-arabinose transferase-like glycosyltransferase
MPPSADAAVSDRRTPPGGSGGVTSSARAAWRSAALWLLLGVTWRATLAWLVPLLPDETYYWEWSRRLEGGYFDHPPGIALLISAGTGWFGDGRLGVRAGPAMAALVAQVGAMTVAWRLAGGADAGAQAAARAACLVTLLPLATLGLVLATPDAPLFATAMLALVAVERALAAPVRSWRSTGWWIAAGLGLGAAMVSKYTAVLLPAGLLAGCVVHPALRARLREPGPWLASLVALALFAPVVAWNAFNDWISFRFQLGHGFAAGARGSPLTREMELLGGQLGIVTPILFVLMAGAVLHAVREGWRDRGRIVPTDAAARAVALAALTIVPLAFFAVSAWRRPVEANWPALAYVGGIVLLAVSPRPVAHGAWWRRGTALAALLLAIVSVQAWRPVLPLAPRRDPIGRAHGWDALARAVQQARRDAFLDGTVDRWVAANRYQEASELAFHLPDQPTVFSLNLSSRPNQYDLWPTAYDRVRPGDGLVAVFDANAHGDSLAGVVGRWFADHRLAATVPLRRGDGVIGERRIWLYRIARDVPRDRLPPSTPSR